MSMFFMVVTLTLVSELVKGLNFCGDFWFNSSKATVGTVSS